MELQIGPRVRAIRQGRDMSQASLAQLADISPSHMCDIEHGRIPSVTVLVRIARALSVTLNDLVPIQ